LIWRFFVPAKQLSGPASDRVLADLPQIARAIMDPHRIEATKGRLVKRSTKAGYTVTYKMDLGVNYIGLGRVPVRSLRELGSLLARIAAGEDARKLFRQNENKKPNKRGEHATRALAYWSVRALNPSAKDTRALMKANSIVPDARRLGAATIRKIAQKHREWAIGFLTMSGIKDPKLINGQIVRLRRPKQIAALREYLRKKSARG
jgi:hypothetical protein